MGPFSRRLSRPGSEEAPRPSPSLTTKTHHLKKASVAQAAEEAALTRHVSGLWCET